MTIGDTMNKRLTFNILNKEVDRGLEIGSRLFGTKASYLRSLVLQDVRTGGMKMSEEKNNKIDIPLTAENCSVSIEEKEAVIKCKIPNSKKEEGE